MEVRPEGARSPDRQRERIGSCGGATSCTTTGDRGNWSDGNVHDVLYEDNRVIDNLGPGIFHEISWNATIRSNIVPRQRDPSDREVVLVGFADPREQLAARADRQQRHGLRGGGERDLPCRRHEAADEPLPHLPRGYRGPREHIDDARIVDDGPGREGSEDTFNWNTYLVSICRRTAGPGTTGIRSAGPSSEPGRARQTAAGRCERLTEG